MVIYLVLVNSLPHWPIIKWFLPCSTSRHLFTWLDSYYIGINKKTLGWVFTLMYFSQVAKEFFWTITHILLHRSTLYCSWLCIFVSYIHCVFFMDMISSGHRSIDPHCIFSGYTFCQYNYGSIVYFMVDIPKKSLSLKHRYACLGFETCHDIYSMVVCIFTQPLCILTLDWKSLQSTSVIIIF